LSKLITPLDVALINMTVNRRYLKAIKYIINKLLVNFKIFCCVMPPLNWGHRFYW